ncbi:hypothetical protein GE21DRAFT_10517 [Neurospora crassa]|uniref:Uncharacterized protein n=1 Tax=Neurospora crassa (strain ATCC 24698 / 74-OR23-1A / CBS 708.71 / DSM 1257 / FGSC 987) TaxID=367110 RepID=Q7S467_NEUCR|nr:hypothetical protein NCU02205 [Neurospora crassa OR74A]EAA30288.1 hypothetical protein NCU02205 [Neurospora crassa OR74A]KHE84066.1 hypothetical protein GE21DRAFT_10517 [Neurospora crassa]|eukprot:XP_959524.1 hypothetical protein NCU02205 [Neurospora crassa OR74A]
MSAQMYQFGISGEGDGNTFYKDAEKKSSFRLFLLGLFGISLATRLGPEMVAIHAHSRTTRTEHDNLMSWECIMQVVPNLFLSSMRILVFAALLIGTSTRIYYCITVHALRRVPG